jgi:hypothetical protein
MCIWNASMHIVYIYQYIRRLQSCTLGAGHVLQPPYSRGSSLPRILAQTTFRSQISGGTGGLDIGSDNAHSSWDSTLS